MFIIESLEPRRLLSFSFVLSGGILTINGSNSTTASQADEIQLTQVGSVVTATDIRTGAAQHTTGTVNGIVVNLLAGNDYLRERANDGTQYVTIQTTVFGGAGNDTIYGSDLNDSISGGDGNDKLVGMFGSDVLDGGAGFDTVDYSYQTRSLAVSLDGVANDGLVDVGNGQSERDNDINDEAIVGGAGNDTLIGSSAADAIDGGAGNDVISGQGGNDTLTGGIGSDTIFGGDGNDFLFAKDGKLDLLNDGTGTDSAQIDSTKTGQAVTDTTTSASPPSVPHANAIIAALKSLALNNAADTGTNPSDLDVTFGTNADGREEVTVGAFTFTLTKVIATDTSTYQQEETDAFRADTLQADDAASDPRKIILVGTVYNGANDDFMVMRLNYDGSLDTTFGNVDLTNQTQQTGYTTTDMTQSFGSADDVANDAVVDAFGRIVVVGTSTNISLSASNLAISRYNEDGTQDVFFGDPDPNNPGLEYGYALYNLSGSGNESGTSIVTQEFDSEGGPEADYVVTGTDVNDGDVGVLYTHWDEFGEEENANITGADLNAVASVADGVGGVWVLASQAVTPNDMQVLNYDQNGEQLGMFQLTYNGIDSLTPTSITASSDGRLFITANDPTLGSGVIFMANVNFTNEEGQIIPSIDEANVETTYDVPPTGETLSINDATLDYEGRLVVVGEITGTFTGGVTAEGYIARYNTVDSEKDPVIAPDDTFNTNTDGNSATYTDGTNNVDFVSVTIGEDDKIIAGSDQGTASSQLVVRLVSGPSVAENILPDNFDPSTGLGYTDPNDPDAGTQPLPDYLASAFVEPTPGPLFIDGTQQDDYISIAKVFDDAGNIIYRVDVNGDYTTYDPAYVTEIDVDGLGGKDIVHVDDALGEPLYINGSENGLTFTASTVPNAVSDNQSFAGIETEPTNGTATIDDGGTPDDSTDDVLTYTPNQNYAGDDYFTYDLNNGTFGDDASQYVEVFLSQQNAPPIANDDMLAAIPENSAPFTISASTLLANDTPGPAGESDQTLTITGLDEVVGGNAEITNSGDVLFTPTANYSGPAGFTYTVTDDGTSTYGQYYTYNDPQSASAVVSFTITAPNQQPVANNDTISNINQDSGPYTISASTLLSNDTAGPASESGQTIKITAVNALAGGTATVATDGDVIFTPDAGFTGPASFLYTITDNGTTNGLPDPKSASATASFTVNPVNHPPTAVPGGPYTVQAGGTVVLNGSGSSDPDQKASSLTYTWDLDGDNIFGETGINATHGDETGTTPTFSAVGLTANTQYIVHLRVTDNGQLVDTEAATINVTAASGTPVKLAGTTIGTKGSFINAGSTGDKAFDGNINTYFDAPDSSNDWTGLDLGVAKTITSISYSPRANWANRMVGGKFQASTDASFSNPANIVTLFTITAQPAVGTFTTVNVNVPTAYRYVRYIGPNGGYCNVAEIQFYGIAAGATDTTPPSQPGTPQLVSVATHSVSIQWAASTDAVGVTRYDVYRSGVFAGSTTTTNFTDSGLPASATYTYTVRAFDAAANASPFSQGLLVTTSAAPTSPSKLIGTVFGTAGSYQNKGSTIANVFDGNTATYFDAPTSDGNVVGLDFGSAKVITSIRYTPRATFAGRMVNGYFQGSNTANFSDAVTLYTITNTPGGTVSVNINNPMAFRYVRYVAPAGSYGNVAELEFDGMDPTTDTTKPGTPGTPVLASKTSNSITLNWTTSTDNVGVVRYDIYRDGTKVGSSTTATYTDTNLAPSSTHAYTVQAFDAANNASTMSGVSSPITTNATSPTPGKLTGNYIGTSGSYNNQGSVGSNAFDGNLNTYFDAPNPNGNYVGLDLGSAKTITQIKYAPRQGWASRMVGGMFQASNDPTFSTGVTTLFTITATPTTGVLTTQTLNVTGTFRYVRYVGPNGSYGNVSEVEFDGF